MLTKVQIKATLPDHVSKEISARAKLIDSSPAEYLAEIAEWWFGQGSPPTTPSEARLLQLLTKKGREADAVETANESK